MIRLGAQVCRRLSEEYCKQSTNDLLDQCGNIFRNTHNQKCMKRECVSQLKYDNVRKNLFDFMVQHFKMSKRDQEESAINIISRGLGCKYGFPEA